MGDTPTPRPTYVLLRGQYTDHGEQVQPRGLVADLPVESVAAREPARPGAMAVRCQEPADGAGLRQSALAAGHRPGPGRDVRGLRLARLDSVASRSCSTGWRSRSGDSGWDVKQMQKLIVMSATYRQSSVATDELLKKDPRNVLLARATRVRMPAEMVRDNALAASGLLVQHGRRSEHVSVPAGHASGTGSRSTPIRRPTRSRPTIIIAGRLYSFIKRNAPHPAMATFDLPDRGTTTVRRQTSNTPLQALVLLDDPQYLEAYRVLATHVLKTGRSGCAHHDGVPAGDTTATDAPRSWRRCARTSTRRSQRYAQDADAAAKLVQGRCHAGRSGRRRRATRGVDECDGRGDEHAGCLFVAIDGGMSR